MAELSPRASPVKTHIPAALSGAFLLARECARTVLRGEVLDDTKASNALLAAACISDPWELRELQRMVIEYERSNGAIEEKGRKRERGE